MKKKLMVLAMSVVGILVAWAETPTVMDVTAKQRYPWNGLVDIDCKVSGIGEVANGYKFVVVAVDKDSGREYAATHFTIEKGGTGVSGWEVLGNGDYELLWDARADLGQVVIERMAMRVTLEAAGVSTGKVQLWEGGPYWADRNVGADNPWDYGLYFWWGDTTGHRPSGMTFDFDFDYKNSAIYTYGKSVPELQSAGWVTIDGVLAPSHDAAHVKCGGSWRMPTYQELSDLCNKCDFTSTKMNGINGCIIRGKGAYASNSIFLPAAGQGISGHSLNGFGAVGRYWASDSPSDSWFNSGYSYGFEFIVGFMVIGDDDFSMSIVPRKTGFSVRPVQGLTK